MRISVFNSILAVAFIVGAFLTPVRAFGQLQPQMLFSRYEFFRRPAGTVAFLPGIERESNVRYARRFGLLPQSGRYELPQQERYCFLVNHRLPEKSGEPSYLGVVALSQLHGPDRRPVSLYRNDGWFRPNDDTFARWNNRNKILSIDVADFFTAHSRFTSPDSIDQEFQYKWHGWYKEDEDGNSWIDREEWFMDTWEDNENNMRLDAMLLKFRFTSKQSSDQLVSLCLAGDRREAIYLKFFAPSEPAFQKSYELVFR